MAVKDILEKSPAPAKKMRPFHGRKLLIWEGLVRYEKISGWVENPRIQLSCRRKKAQVGDRELTQDEVFEVMKMDSDVRLDVLRDDILKNGLREPLVLSSSGRLLDGNRRFFAIRYVLEQMAKGHPDRQDFEKVHAYVLDDSCSTKDEDLVLVEENFHASLKIEWPDYVKASYIKSDWDAGLAPQDIATKYGWNKRKVTETIRIVQIIDDFLNFSTDAKDPEDESGGGLGLTENQAEAIAAKNYQFFNEAQKSFFEQLQADPDFKMTFFRWIANDKFSSFPEVRIAHEAWRDSEARSIISSPEPTAAKDAKAVIDYKKRVLKGKNEVKVRVEEFTRYLEELTAAEISGLPESTLKSLRHAMELVDHMAIAASKAKSNPQIK